MQPPLSNITVIAIEQAVAGPFATRQLADLGARVIKIERPGVGDFARHYDTTAHGLCSHFVWANRSKESLTLDLKQDACKDVLAKLLTNADVLVQNLAPGALERLGFTNERLTRAYPRLIICNISGYGASGPYRDKKAYDALIQAEAGLFTITGTPETPSKAGIAVADIAAAMYAYSGILTALIARGQTGQGAVLEISMFEALAEWMGYPAYYTMGGAPPPRTGSSHAAIAPYGLFPTADGSTVMLSIQNQREWERFCAIVLAQPVIATDPRFANNADRIVHRAELDGLVADVLGQLPLETVVARLEQAQIAYAQSRTMPEFLEHPQLAARNRWQSVPSSLGPIPALLPPVTIEGLEQVMNAIPDVGEQTDAILDELGYSTAQIAQMRAAHAI
ncbi:MAG: CaiB/BaiF CoA-transferase family protein [Caldilineaceae bacterium]